MWKQTLKNEAKVKSKFINKAHKKHSSPKCWNQAIKKVNAKYNKINKTIR